MVYSDNRLGNVKRWYARKPKDADMTISETIKECVCYLSVKVREGGRERHKYGGTAFFVGMPSAISPDAGYIYLVTAKHCIERAKQYGELYLRLNTKAGGYDFVQLNNEWVYSENEGSDVAVVHFSPPPEFQFRALSEDMFATNDVVQKISVGIGDDIFITGLFTERYGTRQNIPIVRSGIIAAMPDEPLRDRDTGLEYDAYLAEVRSIGGLSGSPVCVMKRVFREGERTHTANFGWPLLPSKKLFLLGLIRGHWDYKSPAEALDYIGNELSTVNMGIAIVTPAQDVADILNGEELMKERRKADREALEEHAPTLDSGFTEPSTDGTFTKERFEEALRRSSQKIPSEPEPEKGKE